MVTGNGDVFHLARRDGHTEPKSERSRWQDDQPPSVGVGSLSVAENRIQDPLDRLATVAERYMDFLERKAQANDAEKKQHDERMLTPHEASKILRINVQTVMTWCRKGKNLKGIKVGGNETNGKGGKWLIPREQVDAYLHRERLIHGSQKVGAK